MSELDQEEVDVLESFERGEWRSVLTDEERARLQAAARSAGVKDRRVNIRFSSGDLLDIQARALAEGMPYQTLISSVMHKYVTGRLVEQGDQERAA
ncbi:hypothetical protein [Microbacterium halotolerans]|uniref:hypothetical protein n=1 Tax=Microbacterium halotolerans TaxID=246613 RepID=UPI0019696EFF|nr:hypothetical protein [Microbacterium halotolerans]